MPFINQAGSDLQQLLIVRQTCIKAAVDLLKETYDGNSIKKVIKVAEEFEKWVNRVEIEL